MIQKEKLILGWIEDRKKRNEINKCIFYITVPKVENLRKNEKIKKIEDILDKNNISYAIVDTITGTYNLNRDWIETAEFDCIIEKCGIYPINWDIKDIVEFERMETDGEIIVLADYI